MRVNVKYLEGKKADLEELMKRARVAAQILYRLASGFETAAKTGLYTKQMTEYCLDADKLRTQCNGITSDAGAKLKEVQQALAVERRRRDNLKTMIMEGSSP